MKEYINRLARGKFTYQRPELEVQDYTLTGSVTAGGQGMFTFRFTASQPAYGIVLSSHARVRIEKTPVWHDTGRDSLYGRCRGFKRRYGDSGTVLYCQQCG